WFEKATTDLDAAAAEFADLSDAELTDAASEVFASGTARETLVRYAALAREAAERTLGERAYDTQLVGLIGLLQGHIVQMATGEGKT
ncbi:accessory Sec system translocase SecA2, partial [Burkholderia multivorans]